MEHARHAWSASRWTLAAGLVVGPAFLIVSWLEGAARSGYQARRHPISSLALGPRGWIQTTSFAVTGGGYLASAVVLTAQARQQGMSWAGPVVIGAAAAGITAAAVFTTDPVSGYPPGTPDVPVEPTTAGRLHDLVSVPTFLGLPAAACIYGWGFARTGRPGWAAYSVATAGVMIASLAASAAGFNQAPRFVESAGGWQRVCVASGFAWLSALIGHASRRI